MGNYRVRIKNYLLRKLSLDELYYYREGKKESEKFSEYIGQKKIFFLMTPTYGNLGDQAIEIATEKFLNDYFEGYVLIKIHLQDTYYLMPAVKRAIENEDFVILQGGGNFGSLYGDIERKRRFIVKHIKKNQLISMPSSVFYEDTKCGYKELEKSRKIYSKNKNFTIVSRDYKSFIFCEKYFNKNHNLVFPDMVFYLSNGSINDNRYISIICMRMDKEATDINYRTEIVNKLSEGLENFVLFDTRVERDIPDGVKKTEIQSLINFFRHAKIVVTDRLHAMIFSVITGTPCIVLPSLDNKIKGSYQWIRELEYVKFIEEPTIENIFFNIGELKGKYFDNPRNIFCEKYEKFAVNIKKNI